jgi:gluconolactonase
MDGQGGFWFTDTGIQDPLTRTADMTGIYYVRADGSAITAVVLPVDAPNGIGLSPDGATLYWTESYRGRIRRRTVTGPGELAPSSPLDSTTVLYTLPGMRAFDSLASESSVRTPSERSSS